MISKCYSNPVLSMHVLCIYVCWYVFSFMQVDHFAVIFVCAGVLNLDKLKCKIHSWFPCNGIRDVFSSLSFICGYPYHFLFLFNILACMHAKSVQSYPALCDLWTIAHQSPLSMGLSRQEYWSGLPFPPPGGLPNSGIKLTSLMSPEVAGGFFATSASWEALTPYLFCTLAVVTNRVF